MLSNIRKTLILVICCLAVAPGFSQENSKDIYVSLSGNDKANGNLHAPVKSLEGARDLIRTLKKSIGLPAGGITVWIRGGNYKMGRSFTLTAEDSGERGKPIYYKAYQDEKVSFSLSASIKTDLWKSLNKLVLKRLHPKVKASAMVELDISAAQLKNTKAFAPVNQFLDQWYSLDFVANGKRQPIAQWPNPDENIRGLNSPGWVTANGAKDNFTFYYGMGGNPQDNDQTNELDLDDSSRSLRWKQSLASGHDIWLKGFWRA